MLSWSLQKLRDGAIEWCSAKSGITNSPSLFYYSVPLITLLRLPFITLLFVLFNLISIGWTGISDLSSSRRTYFGQHFSGDKWGRYCVGFGLLSRHSPAWTEKPWKISVGMTGSTIRTFLPFHNCTIIPFKYYQEKVPLFFSWNKEIRNAGFVKHVQIERQWNMSTDEKGIREIPSPVLDDNRKKRTTT